MKSFHAPPPFVEKGKQRTFAKFRAAKHEIDIDKNGSAIITSRIKFETFAHGTPIIDLYLTGGDGVAQVIVDGSSDALETVAAPGNVANYRALRTPIGPGRHTVRIRHEVGGLKPANTDPGVVAFLKMDDEPSSVDPWDGRLFLERYLASNLEFDQYENRIQLRARAADLMLLTNGTVSDEGENEWQIDFPETFTSSCPFLFLGERAGFRVEEFTFPRIGHVPVRVTAFANQRDARRMSKFAADSSASWRALDELQLLFGPFPYNRLVLYLCSNAMEYAGAAEVSGDHILHEVTHSYFGRCVLPADGNAGWIDEAIAYWCENRLLDSSPPTFPADTDPGPMGNQSRYRRSTSLKAASMGRPLLAYLDYLLLDRGGLLPLLARFRADYAFQVVSAPEFQLALERYAGRSFAPEFETFVYGGMTLETYLSTYAR